MKARALIWLALALSWNVVAGVAEADPLAWPAATKECRPWAYWWWMGSAVDATNLTRELTRYRDAGMGGVHIIPIYGAKGWEDKYIEYLSPRWMEMLRHTVTEARRLGLDVDMTTGTGWCFGGPNVSDSDANATAVVKTFDLVSGERLKERFDRATIQALVAVSPEGKSIELTELISTNGEVFFSPPSGVWRVFAVSQKPSGQKVKRAAPGGAGHMLNLIYAEAMPRYLARFTEAFAKYDGPKPRAMYHDSYEYRSDWAPDFFAQFERRRGYRLQTELPALFGKEENDRAARVKGDYRETISDVLAEATLPAWVKWSHDHGFLTRNQAHGSPGNLLDLYAAADIPETEMFHNDRDILVSKFASSAAHVTGKPLVASETGTWLQEHFTETLADLKYLYDDLFLAGVNHVIHHGTCYSPDEAPWPGWLFYASYEMNPRNSIWRDVPALNAYAARCQSVLQSGQPDNDLLLYWPIHDRWHNDRGLGQNFSVHARDWLDGQAIGQLGRRLWQRGFAFDYLSDRQLAEVVAVPPSGGGNAGDRLKAGLQTQTGGTTYRAVMVPACERMPERSLAKLVALAEAGATVIFEKQLPQDVPGWARLEERRAHFRKLLQPLAGAAPAPAAEPELRILKARYGANDTWIDVTDTVRAAVLGNRLSLRVDAPRPFPDPLKGVKKTLEVDFELGGRKLHRSALDRTVLTLGSEEAPRPLRTVPLGKGRVLVGEAEEALASAGFARETMSDHAGLMAIRRSFEGGRHYFIANRGGQPFGGWLPLAFRAGSVVVMDPMTGCAGVGRAQKDPVGRTQVHLQLQPGESIILRCFTEAVTGRAWESWRAAGPPAEITGTWQVKFVAGGPTLPPEFQTTKLASWPELGGDEAQRFAGTARYRIAFDWPARSDGSWLLDLGQVSQSARVRLNGRDLGTLLIPPFRVVAEGLKAKENVLEVEVTNVAANRIRDLDRRRVNWRNFHDINFVNLNYKPFDASDWPLAKSGLLGPVRLIPAQAE